jgi:hypothetical protein
VGSERLWRGRIGEVWVGVEWGLNAEGRRVRREEKDDCGTPTPLRL